MSIRTTTGTTVRDTPSGMIAVHGARELHLIGTSTEQTTRARHLLASRSFDSLFKSARCAPCAMGRNVRFIHLRKE